MEENIDKNRKICYTYTIFCLGGTREEKTREYREKYQSTHQPSPRPVPRFIYDSNNDKHFKIHDKGT